ncbi:MAG: hypothetical protein HW412_232 [Bacteroidetes bacterium]|nr:hypothetical protein [Bacteroidota bacterium]
MNLTLILAVVLVISYQPARCQSQRPFLEAFPSVSLSNLGQAHGIGTHFAYGVSFLLAPSEQFRIGFSADISNPASSYDLIGTRASESIHVSILQVVLGYQITSTSSPINLSGIGSLGLISLSSEERLISAGGFGVIRVPGRSQQSAMISLGIIGSRELAPHLSVFVFPKVLSVSPMQMSSLGYSIGGGLSIGVF